MGRGLDVFRLVPNEHLSQNEIDAAMSVTLERFNAQHQPRIEWPASFALARAHIDQLVRADAIEAALAGRIQAELDRAEGLPAGDERRGAADDLAASAAEVETRALAVLVDGRADHPACVGALLGQALRDLAETLR